MITQLFELLLRHYFGIIGAIFLLLGCWLVVSRLHILSSGFRTTGRIERYTIRRDESDDSESYFPVISFEDENGQAHHFTSTSGVAATPWSGRPREGVKVEIIYSKNNPDKAIVANFMGIWGAPLASIALGVTGVIAVISVNAKF